MVGTGSDGMRPVATKKTFRSMDAFRVSFEGIFAYRKFCEERKPAPECHRSAGERRDDIRDGQRQSREMSPRERIPMKASYAMDEENRPCRYGAGWRSRSTMRSRERPSCAIASYASKQRATLKPEITRNNAIAFTASGKHNSLADQNRRQTLLRRG